MATIGYDAKRIVRNATGLGSYGRTLINDLAPIVPDDTRLLLYAPDKGRDGLRQQVTQRPNVEFAYPRHAQSAAAKALWRTKGIVDDLKADGVSLFHGLSGELPIGIAKSGIPAVATVHDLIFMRHPEFYNPIDVMIYKWKFRLLCREASRIIAISQRTKLDIMELGGFPESRIDVIYQSCGTRFKALVSDELRQAAAERYKLPPRYILSVGTIEMRKNALLAVKALPMLPDDVHLVLVGHATPYADVVRRYAAQHQLEQRLHIIEGVGNDTLPAIYQQAESFVYPSRYEGFGIPIIEAIQSGLPVVAAKGSCLEEAGGPDNLYVDADRPEELAAALRQTLRGAEFRDVRIARSREYVKRFENTAAAKQVLDVYDKMLSTSRAHTGNTPQAHQQQTL